MAVHVPEGKDVDDEIPPARIRVSSSTLWEPCPLRAECMHAFVVRIPHI
jgi:hypothetical protein